MAWAGRSEADGQSCLLQACAEHRYEERHPEYGLRLKLEGSREAVDEISFFDKENWEVTDCLCY